jgi:sulfur-carrier protein adenylyltransferase/sulfurtransferase
MALPMLTPEDIQRYHRHLIIPEVGSVGQRKLKAAKVLLIGAGGLGSPASLYLAAAGVGTLGLVDFDVVDVSNLQRQILHGTSWIGKSKIASGKSRIGELNPQVQVIGHEEPLTSENAFRIFEPYDIIVNGCDNFPTRYLANDAAVLLEKPLVDGSIFRFEGQANVFMPGKGCYRCLYPAPPPPGAVPSCAEAGVLGILPGIIGVIQAIEVVKLILGIGDSLQGRLLLFDALEMKFREVRVRRDPACPVCGDNPTIHELIDYEEFCGMPHRESSVEAPVAIAV